MSEILYDSCPNCGKKYDSNGNSIIINKCSNCGKLYCRFCNSNTYHKCSYGGSHPPVLDFSARTKSKKERKKKGWW